MKFKLKAALAATLALLLALAAIPASALPRFAANAEVAPSWTVSNGYNVHDYTKCVEFLEQTDANGVKNGEKLSENYDPNDPATWGSVSSGDRFRWTAVSGEQRVCEIRIFDCNLCGSLDVSGCTALSYLSCYNNNLTELDVSGCTALSYLSCDNNNLSELDASNNTALVTLFCGNNNLAELDVSGNTALDWLDCKNNNLAELDVSGNTALDWLSCKNNNLAELDVSGNTALGRLVCDNNNLAELDVSNNTALWSLSCDNNNLTELDLSNNPRLGYDLIKAEGNGYVGYDSMRVFAHPKNGASFDGFYDESGALISEGAWSDIYGCDIYEFEGTPTGTVIARFSGGDPTYNAHDYNKIVAFLEQTDDEGVKNGVKLSETYDPNDPETWGTNHFSWTSVNDEQRVREIRIDDCNLCGSLDLSGCNALEHIDCDSNSLTGVDVSNCTALVRLYCADNGITELDVTGCTALDTLSCKNNNLAELDVSNNTALERLYCEYNNLTELDVSNNTALDGLYCYNNNLAELDVSNNTALEYLYCYNNSLAELDVSQNTALKCLACFDNNLTELDVSNNTALERLHCHNNNLTELDVSNNPLLPYDLIKAEGNGHVGYAFDPWDKLVTARPTNGASFDGFYDESGALLSEGTWSESELYNCYVYIFGGTPTGTVIARFSGGEATYNAHDYNKIVAFLEQTDDEGVKNGEKLSDNYDPNDPETWGTNHFSWTSVNDEQRVRNIHISDCNLCGSLDVSNCTALVRLECAYNNLAELDVSNNTALRWLYCDNNNLSELDVSNNTALESLSCDNNNLAELDVSNNTALDWLTCDNNNLAELDVSNNTALRILSCANNNLSELDVSVNTALDWLFCANNNLSELDVSGNTALELLSCANNNLTELDVSQNTALWELKCGGNRLTELDLSNNPRLAYDLIKAEGNGHVGYVFSTWNKLVTARPTNGASFDGFYDESGALLSEGTWSELFNCYVYIFGGTPTGTVIARFSGGFIPGDVDGNGSVSVADAMTVLRIVMGLSDENGVNTDAADMDGNGSITIIDALIILRTAM